MSVRNFILILIVVSTRLALAQPGLTTPNDDNPWSHNVSAEAQATALELYSRGNIEFENARFEQALTLYVDASTYWDHPAIRYNMAIAYNNLGKLLEAEDSLRRALRFGAAPLGERMYQQGLEYQKILDDRLARVKISCREPGTVVSMDGRQLFIAPGELEIIVLPGEHLLVARKQGYMTETESLRLSPGTKVTHDVRLIALKPTTRTERRWAPWKPWVVSGAGLGLIGFGGLAYLLARSDIESYDSGIATRCPHGCDGATKATFDDLNSDLSRSRVERAVAISLVAVGGAALTAGFVGILLNQPRVVNDRVHVTPAPGGGATVLLRWRY